VGRGAGAERTWAIESEGGAREVLSQELVRGGVTRRGRCRDVMSAAVRRLGVVEDHEERPSMRCRPRFAGCGTGLCGDVALDGHTTINATLGRRYDDWSGRTQTACGDASASKLVCGGAPRRVSDDVGEMFARSDPVEMVGIEGKSRAELSPMSAVWNRDPRRDQSSHRSRGSESNTTLLELMVSVRSSRPAPRSRR